MKLAEALGERADLQKKIAQLKERLKDSSKVQEGDIPPEDTKVLYQELDIYLDRLETLVYRINYTNMQIEIDGKNLTQMLVQRDVLSTRVSLMREVLKHVTESDTRYGRNEIKFVRMVDVTELRQKTDTYCRQLRELDNRIQSINWMNDLL